MQRMINTHIEASKIGRQIADQVLDYQRRLGDLSSGKKLKQSQIAKLLSLYIPDSSPDPDPTLAQSVSTISENQLNVSIDIEPGSAGSSSTLASNSQHQRMNGNYASFINYNHARSSTVVSPSENGKFYLSQGV